MRKERRHDEFKFEISRGKTQNRILANECKRLRNELRIQNQEHHHLKSSRRKLARECRRLTQLLDTTSTPQSPSFASHKSPLKSTKSARRKSSSSALQFSTPISFKNRRTKSVDHSVPLISLLAMPSIPNNAVADSERTISNDNIISEEIPLQQKSDKIQPNLVKQAQEQLEEIQKRRKENFGSLITNHILIRQTNLEEDQV
eukprot:TRINITY_DN3105_c0_g1_i1.p1 TRINITY_DN3105_c0_g1~~TRINITY_DN3105_c0_g1_i1.p1  ORF type:complete len:202 (+),score=29.16 TRINITY_DN3105_c0_g1_i1:88-693(+)